jgi:hypothetical protein
VDASKEPAVLALLELLERRQAKGAIAAVLLILLGMAIDSVEFEEVRKFLDFGPLPPGGVWGPRIFGGLVALGGIAIAGKVLTTDPSKHPMVALLSNPKAIAWAYTTDSWAMRGKRMVQVRDLVLATIDRRTEKITVELGEDEPIVSLWGSLLGHATIGWSPERLALFREDPRALLLDERRVEPAPRKELPPEPPPPEPPPKPTSALGCGGKTAIVLLVAGVAGGAWWLSGEGERARIRASDVEWRGIYGRDSMDGGAQPLPDPDEEALRLAAREGTAAAYEAWVAHHAASRLAPFVRERIPKLRAEAAAFDSVLAGSDPGELDDFVRQHPQSVLVETAREEALWRKSKPGRGRLRYLAELPRGRHAAVAGDEALAAVASSQEPGEERCAALARLLLECPRDASGRRRVPVACTLVGGAGDARFANIDPFRSAVREHLARGLGGLGCSLEDPAAGEEPLVRAIVTESPEGPASEFGKPQPYEIDVVVEFGDVRVSVAAHCSLTSNGPGGGFFLVLGQALLRSFEEGLEQRLRLFPKSD